MLCEGHLLLVLHAPPNPMDAGRIGRFFWRDPSGNWSSNDLGRGLPGLVRQLDEYEKQITTLEQKEEGAGTASDYFEVLEQLTPLHRAARNMHQAFQDARKQCPAFRDLIDLRDRAYTIERMADLLLSATKDSLDFTVAKRAEEQAQATDHMAAAAHRLNILAAFFFPLITLAAVFGVDLATVAALFRIDPKDIAASPVLPVVVVGVLIGGLIVGGLLTNLINRPSRRIETKVSK